MNQYRPIFEKDKSINLLSLYLFLRYNMLNILKLPMIFILLYTIYFFVKTPNYSSKVSFYTSYNQANTSSVLNFLPSNLGIQPDNALSFSVENFLSSDKFLKDLVKKEYIIDGNQITLVDYWGEGYNKFFTFNPIGLVSNINSRLMNNPKMKIEEKKLSYAAEALRSSIDFYEDGDSSLNTISVTNSDPFLASQVVQEIYNSVIRYSNEITNMKGKEKREFINSRLSEVKKELENFENQLLSFLEKNKNLNSPSLVLQKDRIEKNIILTRQLYFNLSDQFEMAKIEEKDDTSSIFLLDSPHISPKKAGLTLLEGLFLIFVMSSFLSSSYYLYINRKELIE